MIQDLLPWGLAIFASFFSALHFSRREPVPEEPLLSEMPPSAPESPVAASSTPQAAVVPPAVPTVPESEPNPDVLLPWNTTSSLSHANWHNVRVLCDLEGLNYTQKEELTATVWGESEFNTHAICVNYGHYPNGAKYVASTDHGIAQWNDYYHGKEITPLEAVNDPEKAIRLMCKYFLSGRQNQWVCYSTGRYRQFMGRTL